MEKVNIFRQNVAENSKRIALALTPATRVGTPGSPAVAAGWRQPRTLGRRSRPAARRPPPASASPCPRPAAQPRHQQTPCVAGRSAGMRAGGDERDARRKGRPAVHGQPRGFPVPPRQHVVPPTPQGSGKGKPLVPAPGRARRCMAATSMRRARSQPESAMAGVAGWPT